MYCTPFKIAPIVLVLVAASQIRSLVSANSQSPNYSQGQNSPDVFLDIDETSRGIFFPSLKATVGGGEGGLVGGDDLAGVGPGSGVSGDASSRGFLTKKIGKYLDKDGNEMTTLCYRDSMCAGNADGRTSCYRGRCVECQSSSDCTDAARPVCDTLSRTCVQCTSTSDCGTGVCGPGHVCVECTSDSRCAGRGTYIDFICSTYGGNPREQLLMNTCAECVVNSDCPYRMICDGSNTCSCTSDSQCDSPQPYCYNGRCQACAGTTVGGHGVCSNIFFGGTCQLRESSSEVYRCVECQTSDDCGGAACIDGSCSCVTNGCATGFCNTQTQRCVSCLSDSHCLDSSAPYCGASGQCVQCTGENVTCRKETTVGMVHCNGEYGTCEPTCEDDTDCVTAVRPYCDVATSRCAPCRDDVDCAEMDPSAPFCLAGEVAGVPTPPRCVQCQVPGSSDDCELGLVCNQHNYCASCSSNEECPKERPICSQATRSCVACDDDAGLFCPKERPICYAGQCLGCQYDSDCGNVLKCDQETNRCELCLTHGDCFAMYGDSRPFCSSPHGTCMECRGSKDCSDQFPLCSDGVCVQCTADSECGNGGICDTGSGRCVDCLEDSQCWDTLPYCMAGRCVACQDDSHCGLGTSCMDGICKECDATTSAVCTTMVQKQYQSCSPGLTCESNVAVGSLVARVLHVDGDHVVMTDDNQ